MASCTRNRHAGRRKSVDRHGCGDDAASRVVARFAAGGGGKILEDHVMVATAGHGDRTQEQQCQFKHVLILSGVPAESNTGSAMTTFWRTTQSTIIYCVASASRRRKSSTKFGTRTALSPFGPLVRSPLTMKRSASGCRPVSRPKRSEPTPPPRMAPSR